MNAIVPPVVAALRLPFMLGLGFIIVLLARRVDAEDRRADLARLDHGRLVRVGAARRARRSRVVDRAERHLRRRRRRHVHAARDPADRPQVGRARRARTCRASSTSRSTGSRYRCSGARCGTATPRRWRVAREGSHRLVEWETDLSSQTGASQAGILLGSNEDIPAFRWVEKERGALMTCSAPADCAEIERRHAHRRRAARRRRLEPRQPALGRGRRGHPDREPDRGREVGEPGLPRIPRQRLQRHARPGPLLLGGHPGVDRRARGRSGATSGREGIAAATTRSCAARCASSSAT